MNGDLVPKVMLMWWVHLWKKLTSPFAASNLPVHFCIERSVWFWIIQLTHPLQTLTTWQILAPLSCLLRLSAPWYLCSLIPTNFLPPSRDWEWYYMLWWHFLLTAPGPNKTFHLLTVEIISSVLLHIQITMCRLHHLPPPLRFFPYFSGPLNCSNPNFWSSLGLINAFPLVCPCPFFGFLWTH